MAFDKRYQFIRSDDKFRGLEDYAESTPIEVKRRKIEYPIQQTIKLSGAMVSGYGLRTKLGKFFELLAQGIYGGKIRERGLINGEEFSLMSEPDIIHRKTKSLREIKATCSGSELKLSDEQVSKYAIMQIRKDSDLVNPLINFEIFRHGIGKVQRNFMNKPLEKLIEKLSENVRFMISLPFSIVYKIHSGENNKLTSRYDGDRFDTLTRLRSIGLNAMIAYPEETIRGFGLDLEDYVIEKSKLPENITVNGIQIRTFPILLVYDRNHLAWTKEFRKRMKKKLEEIRKIDECYLDPPSWHLINTERSRQKEKDKAQEKIPFNIPDEAPFEIGEVPPGYDPRRDGCSDEEEGQA